MDITEKYFRVCVTIDLDAIYNNVMRLKDNLKVGTKVIAVIKTDGYGHGAVPVAYTIDELVNAYAVATIDEAVNLRKNGIKKPIYVIGYTHNSQMERVVENEVRPAVFTMESAIAASNAAKKLGKTVKIHIKIDTGMSRIGFKICEESIDIIKKINALDNLEIEGIFTHFATADEKDKSKTIKQLEKFKDFTDTLEKEGVYIPVKHCSNSAAMMEIKEANMDAVRAGIAMYGLYPSDEVDKKSVELIPSLGLKSHIVYIKDVEEGTEISYGGTFVADKKMKVATVPVGYGDGYRRSLSNKGYVLIRGYKAKILGRICMDQFMVDVTDIDDVCLGDEVVLIGRSGNEKITTEEIAKMAGDTFNYEVVCDLGKRMPRVYYRKGKVVCTKDYFDDKYDVNMV